MTHEDRGRFGRAISILDRAAKGYFYHKLKDLQIGPGQQAYLLSLQPQELIPQEELARRLKVDKANVTRALTGLEQKGYLERERSTKDQRVWLISLTTKGVQVRGKVEEIAAQWIDQLKAPLSHEEWNQMEEALEKIIQSL